MKRTTLFTVLLVILLAGTVAHQITANAERPNKALRQFTKKHHKAVCDLPEKGRMNCDSHVIADNNTIPQATASPSASSYGPIQFHTAYNLPCTPLGPLQSICTAPNTFGPQTIAIVDAYHTPNIENDLNIYSSNYGLPACTKANGCLTILNQNGSTPLPQVVDSGWAMETSLDVEVAHEICQTCKILLLEANSNKLLDLATAVNSAAHLGATAISNSYGGAEWSGETSYDGYFNHPGTAITFSSGDNGYGTEYPASSPNVTAVGGTTLNLYTDNSYANETVWSGSGSGCSLYENAGTWQTNLPNWSQLGCSTSRAVADVSADADPNTGAAVYDSTPYSGSSGWWQIGGTSLSAPIIAATYALNGGVPASTIGVSLPYLYFTSLNSHDILTGSNGICVDKMCSAMSGYDGPTGLGTPNGVTGFGLNTPTNTPTNTPIPTPTATPTPTTTTDITPPLISITYPTNNSNVPKRSYINVTANASDNIGVTKVLFIRDGKTICTITSGIYSCSMYTANGTGIKVTYKATAFDGSGNSTTATVKVTTN